MFGRVGVDPANLDRSVNTISHHGNACRLRAAGAVLRPNSPPCPGPCWSRARARVSEFGNPR